MLQELEIVCIKAQIRCFKHFRRIKKYNPRNACGKGKRPRMSKDMIRVQF
jgi:hypothetical protein